MIAPLSDDQVSMLLSEAEAGWPGGAADFVAAHMGGANGVFCAVVAIAADIPKGWSHGDAESRRDAAGRLLRVLIRHGLVRCGECEGTGGGYACALGRGKCHACNGTGSAT